MCNEKEPSNTNCCVPHEETIYVNSLAVAYVPIQKYCTMFSPEESLINGTVFPELFKPYDYRRRDSSPC